MRFIETNSSTPNIIAILSGPSAADIGGNSLDFGVISGIMNVTEDEKEPYYYADDAATMSIELMGTVNEAPDSGRYHLLGCLSKPLELGHDVIYLKQGEATPVTAPFRASIGALAEIWYDSVRQTGFVSAIQLKSGDETLPMLFSDRGGDCHFVMDHYIRPQGCRPAPPTI